MKNLTIIFVIFALSLVLTSSVAAEKNYSPDDVVIQYDSQTGSIFLQFGFKFREVGSHWRIVNEKEITVRSKRVLKGVNYKYVHLSVDSLPNGKYELVNQFRSKKNGYVNRIPFVIVKEANQSFFCTESIKEESGWIHVDGWSIGKVLHDPVSAYLSMDKRSLIVEHTPESPVIGFARMSDRNKLLTISVPKGKFITQIPLTSSVSETGIYRILIKNQFNELYAQSDFYIRSLGNDEFFIKRVQY